MEWEKKLDEMVSGYRDAMILVAALKTGIFEALAAGPLAPAAVAAKCGLDTRAVDIVLHALAAAGILGKQDGNFALDPEVRPLLLADSPRTLVSILGHNRTLMHNWLELPTVLRTGRPAPRAERTEEEMRDFICGMENISRRSSVEVAAKVDLDGIGRLLDLGGGPGTAAITFCRKWPDLKAVVFDLPGPLGIAAAQIASAGLADRVTTVAGDFLVDDLGHGFDAVYISNIIHSLGPDDTLALLRRVHGCLAPRGRILLKDFFLEPDRIHPAHAARFSVNMLTATEAGKSYTRDEARALLTAAGFGDFSEVPVAARSLVIRGIRES